MKKNNLSNHYIRRLFRFFSRYFFRFVWRNAKSNFFGFEKGYERSARLWFYAIIISVSATIAIAFIIKDDLDHLIVGNENSGSILAIALVKLLLIVAPLYAIRFSVRNYSANKHLVVVNEHKAVVMKTLLSFIDRGELSPELKGELMTIAIRETFATPETGFLAEKDNPTSIEQNIFDKITRNQSINT